MINSHLVYKHIAGSMIIILYREGGHYRLEIEKHNHRISYAVVDSLRGNIGDVIANIFTILDREYSNPVQELKRQLMVDLQMIGLRTANRGVLPSLPEEYWDQL